MEIKAKINTWDLLKLKNCCTTKETIKKDSLQIAGKYLQIMWWIRD